MGALRLLLMLLLLLQAPLVAPGARAVLCFPGSSQPRAGSGWQPSNGFVWESDAARCTTLHSTLHVSFKSDDDIMPARNIAVNSSAAWTFIGGAWSTQPDQLDPIACKTGDRSNCVAPGAAEVIVPSVETADYNLAFLTGEAFALTTEAPTLVVEFDWRTELYWTSPGLIWGTDATHFYEVSFPVAGQQFRCEHSWLLVARINASSGWREAIEYKMLNGLSSAITVWHHTAVAISSKSITVTVDGIVSSTTFVDTGLVPFHIGLSTYDSYGSSWAPWAGGAWPVTSRFRALTVSRDNPVPPVWSDTAKHVSPWRAIAAAVNPTGTGSPMMRKEGKLLVANGDDCSSVPAGVGCSGVLLESTDSVGSDWIAINRTTAGVPPGPVLRMRMDLDFESYDLIKGNDQHQVLQLVRKVGTNARETVWTHSWPWLISTQSISLFLPLRNGSLFISFMVQTKLLTPVVGGPNVTYNVSTPQFTPPNYTIMTFPTGSTHEVGAPPCSLAYSIVSHTNGSTWEYFQPLDGPPLADENDNAPFSPQTPYIPKYTWMSEWYGTELRDGSIIVFIRPGSSPALWQAFAPSTIVVKRVGSAFGPMTRGMAPMYACAMVTTASGVVLIGGRHPGQGLLASWDNAMTWSTYSIDTATWSQGVMVEVAQDVVL